MTGHLRDVWERFLLFFPLVSMGLLALGTYWLVRSTPPGDGPVVQRPVAHEPDYFLDEFSVKTFDGAGRVRTEVHGSKARHYPDTLWLEVDRIRVRSFDEQGRMTTASAERGLTNEDASEVQLMGNAVLVRDGHAGQGGSGSPRVEYRGEFLHAFMNTERVESNKPVQLVRGNDRFTADRMEFDNVEQVLLLSGRVRGTLMPVVN
jgi:lipopolysaccharide export system protein LptC